MTKTSIRQRLDLIVDRARLTAQALDHDDPGEALWRASTMRGEVDRALTLLVRHAIDRGASWSEVGKALGITRQSAWERFGRDDKR